jgi:hypothetical protein
VVGSRGGLPNGRAFLRVAPRLLREPDPPGTGVDLALTRPAAVERSRALDWVGSQPVRLFTHCSRGAACLSMALPWLLLHGWQVSRIFLPPTDFGGTSSAVSGSATS